jgi:ribokinase
MTNILVVGGASSDLLHIPGGTVSSPGGAGMYTAMAAHCAGATVTLFAPRPESVPDVLQPVRARLQDWLGPRVSPEALPHFEIAYEGARTTYITARFEAESLLTPDLLPDDLSGYALVHIVPLGDLERQLAFVRACRARGARRISAGTYLNGIRAHPETARAIMAEADLFFMNDVEAQAVTGSVAGAATGAGQVLFVTQGAQGAQVWQGAHASQVPALRVMLVDPTGAGDTFCGAALALLAQGAHPIVAARRAAVLASQSVQQVGPQALFDAAPLSAEQLDPRVTLNAAQIERTAARIATLEDAAPFDFTGLELPPVGDPGALDFFFSAVLQQFGFWTEQAGIYEKPLIAPIAGAQLKGAFYLFRAWLRRHAADAAFCTPAAQAALDAAILRDVFRADDGSDPMPAFDLHLAQANAYGRDMQALGLTPARIVTHANASARPLQTLMMQLDRIGGYKEDPLRKKSSLLALALSQRPEGFFRFGPGEDVQPIIDYHLMRSCLRIGLIDINDAQLQRSLAARSQIGADDEWAVRYAAYRAIERLVALSGRSMGAVDWFFFGARRRCPEMTEPDCPAWPVDALCAHRRELFQPVILTTYY